MKKVCFLAAITIIVMLLVSCGGKSVSKPPQIKLQPFTVETEKEGVDIAAVFADGFVKSVKSGEFKPWQEVMPPHIAAKVSPEQFAGMYKELNETLGKLESSTFLGTLENGNLRDNLWKLRFSKDGKACEVLYLVRVYCGENNKVEISGFGIKRF